ncbi:MAG: lytic transglycosylase domain-containing protein [Inquilinus sp.]
MELATAVALARACAPLVAPETLLSVAHAESRLNPYAIGVNDGPRLDQQPASRDEAIAIATQLIVVEHKSVDLGLGQLNSRNLDRLGLSITDAFDPCRNLAGAARVLEEAYQPSRDQLGDGEAALGQALSRYNTGKPDRGFSNGYVARVQASADMVVPAISARLPSRPDDIRAAIAGPSTVQAGMAGPASSAGLAAAPASAAPAPRPFDVFAADRDRSWDVFHPAPSAPADAPLPADGSLPVRFTP